MNKDEFIEEVAIYDDDVASLHHYGTPRHSGRYPWGSGENPFQGDGKDFYSHLETIKNEGEKNGISKADMNNYIAKYLGISTTQLRNERSYAKDLRKLDMIDDIRKLREEHPDYSNSQIGEILGQTYNFDKSPVGESTVRSLMNTSREENAKKSMTVANLLMDEADKKRMIDVGPGVEHELGVSNTKLDTAISIALKNGYKQYNVRVPQQGNPGQFTTLKVLAKGDVEYKDVYNFGDIGTVADYISPDNGKTIRKAFEYPASMDGNRVMVRYAEEGGKDKDGLIEIRRGVKDLSLGNSDYAQVRILVDNDRYLKGMAAYSDGHDMPEGVDIIFNTNKPKGTDKRDVLKKIKTNADGSPSDNPFGALIKERGGQSYYDDPNGKYEDPITGKKQSLSLINKRSEEGDWSEWSKEITSQMLGKQPQRTIDRQLNESKLKYKDDFDSIMEVTNPTIKASLLNDFADNLDANSAYLKAASLPGSKYHVILPVPSLKDNEVYAPNYPDGTQLALVRYPHAGLFEIPILTVNNRNPEAIDRIGRQASDAIGINAKNAGILSGADFDGDTVQVIPTNNSNVKIANKRPLEGLAGFDPTEKYGPTEVGADSKGNPVYFRDGVRYNHISEDFKQKQMGIASNLITDMTLKGASDEELAAAVRHSMVVIDSFKHHLDYRASERDNHIQALKDKYQKNGPTQHGASTLLSRAKSPIKINERKEGAYYAKDTGKELKVLDEKSKLYIDPDTGAVYNENQKTTRYVDPETGKKLWHETGNIYAKVRYVTSSGNKATSPAYVMIDGKFKKPTSVYALEQNGYIFFKDHETGKYMKVRDGDKVMDPVYKKEDVYRMYLTDDANELSSGTLQEKAYANYANYMKTLANKARKEALYYEAHPIAYSKEAANSYSEEVTALNSKIRLAEMNIPRERAANTIAAAMSKEKINASSEDLSDKDKQKIRQQELVKAREKLGAHSQHFLITDKEWEAIQHGAISKEMLKKIMRFADSDRLKQLATPLDKREISENMIAKVKALGAHTTTLGNGNTVRAYTNADIAQQLGISASEVSRILNGKE